MFASSHLVMLNCSTCNSNISFTPHFTTKQYFFFVRNLKLNHLVGRDSSEWLKFKIDINLLVFPSLG